MAKELINKTDISDVMIERPVSFSIKRKHFSVYPATLGKIQLTARLVEAIGLDKETDAGKIHQIIIQSANTHRSECLRLIAYSTLPGMDCLDENKVYGRLEELRAIDDADIASLLLVILTQDKTELIERHFLMHKERERMNEVMKVKKQDKNSVSFGGRSVWGTLIDAACERYGWSYQYVLWGISYSNLQLLFADQIRQVFLTDEERKKVHIPTDGVIISADNTQALNQFIKTQSWK